MYSRLSPLVAILQAAIVCTLLVGSTYADVPAMHLLSERSIETFNRMDNQMSSWTVTVESPMSVKVTASVHAYADHRNIEVFAHMHGQRQLLAQIIISEGIWYVKEQLGIHGRYRPYEAPFNFAILSRLIELVEPIMLYELDQEGGEHLGTIDKTAIFRMPLPPQQVALIELKLEHLEKMALQLSQPNKVKKARQQLQQRLIRGKIIEVDTDTGMLAESSTAMFMTTITDFQWYDTLDERIFQIPNEGEDLTYDLTESNMDEVLMASNFVTWTTSNGFRRASDGRLLNLNDDSVRRIPFIGKSSQAGCFLKDRKSVVVLGYAAEGASNGLYIIDLSTGENRELHCEELGSGYYFHPSVSPDGKTIAVHFFVHPEPAMPSKVVLFDVGTSESEIIGEVTGGHNISWLPDGKHLFMGYETFVSDDRPTEATICIMDMDGRVQDIRAGARAILLEDQRILFTTSVETRVWYTCNLDGSNVQEFFGGMPECAFPTRSPDGTRLFMSRKFPEAELPDAVIIGIKDGTIQKATDRIGAWTFPVWH